MIIGMGADMTDIRRVQETLERFGDRYIQRCFTAIEQQKPEGRAPRAWPRRGWHVMSALVLAGWEWGARWAGGARGGPAGATEKKE